MPVIYISHLVVWLISAPANAHSSVNKVVFEVCTCSVHVYGVQVCFYCINLEDEQDEEEYQDNLNADDKQLREEVS